LLAKIPETLGLQIKIRSDSVVSLVNQNPSPKLGAPPLISTRFRPLERQ
jgi:hypothetical protein